MRPKRYYRGVITICKYGEGFSDSGGRGSNQKKKGDDGVNLNINKVISSISKFANLAKKNTLDVKQTNAKNRRNMVFYIPLVEAVVGDEQNTVANMVVGAGHYEVPKSSMGIVRQLFSGATSYANVVNSTTPQPALPVQPSSSMHDVVDYSNDQATRIACGSFTEVINKGTRLINLPTVRNQHLILMLSNINKEVLNIVEASTKPNTLNISFADPPTSLHLLINRRSQFHMLICLMLLLLVGRAFMKPKSRFEYKPVCRPKDGVKASTSKNSNVDSRVNGASTSKNAKTNMAMTSSNKGPVSSDDINMVTLRNSFAASNEEDKVFEKVDTSNARNDGNIVKDATNARNDNSTQLKRQRPYPPVLFSFKSLRQRVFCFIHIIVLKMDTDEPSYDTEQTQRGSAYLYSLGVFSGFFLLIILFYISYICKRHTRFQSPPPTAISLATSTNGTNNNHHFIRLPRGLDDDVLVTFPTYVYSEVIMSSKEDASTNTNSSECAICLSDYKPSDVIRVLQKCGHLFHVKCIDTWLNVHPTCPVCRKSPVADMAPL
ncbi:zinc finger, RING/FYVE/PHD-type [Artemisia annua]|uniref:RING-type E3 ubiquitin transferase n=1 Tax=Artemisia annua TaxID=35608 RepID=A0A2U1MDJ8_ARTAN|nr:zinc finger, RING/FYVE/PHD-type [Artemisia annua]